MEALDGNAIAGALYDVFGREMTTVTSSCAHCGATYQLGEQVVYLSAGSVVRCRSCGDVILVLVETRERTLVDLRDVRGIDTPS